MSIFGSQQTVENTGTFSFNDDDAARITANIGGTREFLTVPQTEVNTKELLRLKKRELALNLHLITLAEYYKTKRIPRGLRCHLRPTLYADDLTFCQHFEGILNKASFDIILLVIERTQQELKELKPLITNLESNLFPSLPKEEAEKAKEELQTTLSEFQVNLENRKRQKFQRDYQDYQSKQVYRGLYRPLASDNQQFYTHRSGSSSDSSGVFFRGRQKPYQRRRNPNKGAKANAPAASGGREQQGIVTRSQAQNPTRN